MKNNYYRILFFAVSYKIIKRVADFSLSFFLMAAFSWLFILIFLGYLFLFHTPFFFVHERIGQEGKYFNLWKFRTLNEQGASLQERRFSFGDFLRFTSLDELPQLWNVLKGDMSLIGPRPLPVEYLPLMNDSQRRRHQVRPGITGWAQVNGRNSISWYRKFELDNYYVDHVSLKLDLLILFRTVSLLLSFRKDVSLNEEKFKGN